MNNKLEEIRKRSSLPKPGDLASTLVDYQWLLEDRRWLLGEVERLREALKIYADKQNWWQTDPTSIEWQGDPEEFPWDIALRALAGEFTGKIETVKLYPGKALTPEEISNDYEEARRRLLGEVDAQREELERLRAIETNVKGIILFLLRHLQEIRETASGDPGVKYAIEIGYLDCLGTLKDALFEAAPAEEE